MADYSLPLDIAPGAQSYRLRDFTSVFTSTFTGAQRTVSRPGRMLGCTLEYVGLNAAQRHRLVAILSLITRADRVWVPDFATALRGTFPATELLANTAFPNTTGWTSTNAELVLTADSGRLRLTRTAVAADRYAYAPATTSAGLPYLFRAGVLQGRTAPRYSLNVGTSGGATDLVAGSQITTAGVNHVVATASGGTTYPSIRDYSGTRAANDFQVVDSPSFARCALVNGGAQTGSSLWIDQLPASTEGLLLAGDLVTVYTGAWEPKRCVLDLKSNSSGQGQLVFEPPLRASPADNAPISIYRPMARYILATDEVAWDTRQGLFSDFTLDFIEDIP